MPLPVDIQNYLRQYDNNEISWAGIRNVQTMNLLADHIWQHNQNSYVHSRRFATDMRLFAETMYTSAELQSYPSPMPQRICKNAIRCLRRRV